MNLRTWLQGSGVAALVLFVFYRSLIQTPGELRMHTPGSVANLTISLIVNLILVSLLFMFIGIWLRRTSRWAWLRLLVPALVLTSVANVIYIAFKGWISTQFWIAVLFSVLVLTLLLHWLWRRGEKLLLQLSGAVLIGLGFYCIFVVFQLLHLAMWRQTPNYTAETHTAITDRTDRPRTVWILFDELSYQQTFGDRYPNLQLPNFDDFRKTSTLFTDTQPIINETEKAIPSMFLGESIKRVYYTTGNELEVGSSTGPLHPFKAAQTPFALARQYGWTTGVVGWNNPYCGMLAPYLNQCYWTYEFREPAVSAQKDFSKDLSYPWVRYGMIFAHPRQMLSRDYRAHVIEDLMNPAPGKNLDKRLYVYHDLMQHAVGMLGPSGPDFVFLHLSVPHPPGFYNRKTQQFDTSGLHSYIDSLALTDKTLGQFLTILRQSPRWKNTNVIVCGDHSWRVYGWAGGTSWTPEAEAASHGRVFDPRPVLMVHLAGQTTPATVAAPFPLLRVHTILDDLVAGKPPSFSIAGAKKVVY